MREHTETVCSKWNPSHNRLHQGSKYTKVAKKSPSRFRTNAKRLQVFLEKKVQSSKDFLDSQQPGSPVAVCDPLKDLGCTEDSPVIPSSSTISVCNVHAEGNSIHEDADVKINSSPEEAALQVATAAQQESDNSLHSPPTPGPAGESDFHISHIQTSDCSVTPLPSSPLGTSSKSPELGSVIWLSDQPGSFVRYEGKKMEKQSYG